MKATSLIDWLTFRIANVHDPDAVIRDWLKMDPALFETFEAAGLLPNYRSSKRFGGIAVCYDGCGVRGALADGMDDAARKESADRMGVCVSMPGTGCRTFENMTELRFQEGGAMYQILHMIYLNPDASATRVDLAMDERGGLLDMETIIECVRERQYNSHVRRSRVILDGDGKKDCGQTVYIGAPSSSFRIRIYDKAKEQYKPEQPEYGKPWIRVELVMRDKNANGFIDAFCNSDDLGKLAASILNDKLRFIEPDDSNISRCSTAQWWLDFVQTVEEVKLFIPEAIQHTVDSIGQWLTNQCAPSLSMFFKAYGWDGIYKLLSGGAERMSIKHKALLKDLVVQREIGKKCRAELDKLIFARNVTQAASLGANG